MLPTLKVPGVELRCGFKDALFIVRVVLIPTCGPLAVAGRLIDLN